MFSTLRNEVLTNLKIERAIAAFRSGFLAKGGAGPLEFMIDVACQCFNNEYIYPVSEQERAALSRLGKSLSNIRDLVVYAMYEPLYTVRDAALRLGFNRDYDTHELFTRQISEPDEEREIQKEIPSVGVIDDPVSVAVRQQYEEYPYPRWIHTDLPKPCGFHAAMQERYPFLGLSSEVKPTEILVAGCGTGRHAIHLAAKHPNANITALDLSKASLAYGIRQSRRYSAKNINFIHGDILTFEAPATFDAIEAIGVLHHMSDPLAGIRALTASLKPDGFMLLGLYSRRARAGLEAARLFVRERMKNGSSKDELRRVRQEIIGFESGLGEYPAEFRDFYSMSEFRDLLYHAHEVSFYPQDLPAFLREKGLTILGYRGIRSELRTKYRVRFPQDPFVRDLKLVDAFESEHPETFKNLQTFWVQAS